MTRSPGQPSLRDSDNSAELPPWVETHGYVHQVATRLIVRQDFVAKDRLAVFRGLLPTDDRLGNFLFQERLNVRAVQDVFVVLHIVPVRPFDGERFLGVGQNAGKYLSPTP